MRNAAAVGSLSCLSAALVVSRSASGDAARPVQGYSGDEQFVLIEPGPSPPRSAATSSKPDHPRRLALEHALFDRTCRDCSLQFALIGMARWTSHRSRVATSTPAVSS